MPNVACVLDAKSLLGEGPYWDAAEQHLYWVDIKRQLIHRFDPRTGEDRTWSTPEDIGSLAVREKGGLLDRSIRPGAQETAAGRRSLRIQGRRARSSGDAVQGLKAACSRVRLLYPCATAKKFQDLRDSMRSDPAPPHHSAITMA